MGTPVVSWLRIAERRRPPRAAAHAAVDRDAGPAGSVVVSVRDLRVTFVSERTVHAVNR
jgi:hypothetical protein